MTIQLLEETVKTRGDKARIAQLAGVSESTVGRLLKGMRLNPGLNTVAKIEAACRQLEKERKAKAAAK